MDYKEKYLKYKNKYLTMKQNQSGGVLPQNFHNLRKLDVKEIDAAIEKTRKEIKSLEEKIQNESDEHKLNEILLNIEKNNLELQYMTFLKELKEIGRPNENTILQYSKILDDNQNILEQIGRIEEEISAMEYEIKKKEIKESIIKKHQKSSQQSLQKNTFRKSPGDGNCQFHSILRSARQQKIYLGDLKTPFDLKKVVRQYVELYGLDPALLMNLQYADYGHTNMSKYRGRELIRQINKYFSKPYSYGNYISLLALSTMLEIQINVYHQTINGYEILFVVGDNQGRQVNILYNGHNHYDWLFK